jgi:hypothetical protein
MMITIHAKPTKKLMCSVAAENFVPPHKAATKVPSVHVAMTAEIVSMAM